MIMFALENAMTITLDEEYAPRPWCCEQCGRLLGVVMRDANRVRRLWIFARELQLDHMPAVQELQRRPRGLFKVHAVDHCEGVECSICGALNEWSISKEALDRLLKRYLQAGSV